MKIQFHGANDSPVAAAQLLKFEGFEILIDSGLSVGAATEPASPDADLGFEPARLHSVLLSNCALDHSGNLPALIRRGFGGTVFATTSTQDMCGALLRDYAVMHERDCRDFPDLAASRTPAIGGVVDAERSLYAFNGAPLGRPVHVLRNVRCCFHSAGCSLGAAIPTIDVHVADSVRRIAYAVDIGSPRHPIYRRPEAPEDVEVLILGAGVHGPGETTWETAREAALQALRRTARQGGRMLIPAFTAGALENILPLFAQAWREEQAPRLPIYVDSPLSVNIEEAFRHHSQSCDQGVRRKLLEEDDPFGFAMPTYVRSEAQSQNLVNSSESCIIVAPTADLEAGTALRHLRGILNDPDSVLLLAERTPPGTLARRLAEGASQVDVLGQRCAVEASVVPCPGLKRMADTSQLAEYAQRVHEAGNGLEKVFVVHGECALRHELAHRVSERLQIEVVVPDQGETFEI